MVYLGEDRVRLCAGCVVGLVALRGADGGGMLVYGAEVRLLVWASYYWSWSRCCEFGVRGGIVVVVVYLFCRI